MTDRKEYQVRAEQAREARGRPGWNGTLRLNEKRHEALKKKMFPGETVQAAIIRLAGLDDDA